jgi:hypothetical protein
MPAGSCAPRNVTFPVALMRAEFGARTANVALDRALGEQD